MSSSHYAKFTWGAGPQTVCVAGGFNSWSATATPLQKIADGSFEADVPLPWGEKQAFKYVVDGEWKVREDEAKEWDAAGNMNNVYTAPHAPESNGNSNVRSPATRVSPLPPSTQADTPSPTATTSTTEPSTLIAASAPAAASGGYAPTLGAVSTHKEATGAAVPAPAAVATSPATTADPTPVQIEKTAANANVGEAPVEGEAKTYSEQAAEYATGAMATLGAVVGGAAAAVEKATGLDLTHSSPISVDEAKAQGINVNELKSVDAETDAVAPVDSKPSGAAIADLEEKVQELKVAPKSNGDAYANAPVPLEDTAAGATPTHDIPAQHETAEDNHQTVPQPIITAVSAKDPKKERSLDAPTNTDTVGTKPISNNPAISAEAEKVDAEQNPGRNGSTPAAATGAQTVAGTGVDLQPGETSAAPDAKSANIPPAQPAPSTPAKAAPATPAKPVAAATPASISSTPASTPAKSQHGKEATAGSDVRKRKSSFFGKIKHAFSPKDKEKK